MFAFGHGLSYTRFKYGEIKLSAKRIDTTGSVTVRIDVRNTGSRAGDEVVQLYAHERQPAVTRPIKQLVAFERVPLRPGERKHISFTVPASKLAYWDTASHAFITHPGPFDLMVGAASDDLRAKALLEVRASSGR